MEITVALAQMAISLDRPDLDESTGASPSPFPFPVRPTAGGVQIEHTARRELQITPYALANALSLPICLSWQEVTACTITKPISRR